MLTRKRPQARAVFVARRALRSAPDPYHIGTGDTRPSDGGLGHPPLPPTLPSSSVFVVGPGGSRNEKKVRVCDTCHGAGERFRKALLSGSEEAAMEAYSTGCVNLRTPYTIYHNEVGRRVS